MFVMIMDFFGNDNISLDVSGQVRKLHFHPVSRALGIGMPFPCGHFYFFFATSLVLRCGIGLEMSTPNFKSTLHIWKLRSQRLGLLTCSRTLFSVFPPLLWSKVCNAMASGRNMCHPAPKFAEKGKSGSACAMEVVHIQEWLNMKHHEAFGGIRWGNK